MNTNSFAFDSQFSIGLYGAVVDEFLSVVGFQEMPSEIIIAPHQLSIENATSFGIGSTNSYSAIATTGVSQPILAQQFEETNLGKQVQDSWTNFVESGQIWALCVGFLFGYMFRTFTGG